MDSVLGGQSAAEMLEQGYFYHHVYSSHEQGGRKKKPTACDRSPNGELRGNENSKVYLVGHTQYDHEKISGRSRNGGGDGFSASCHGLGSGADSGRERGLFTLGPPCNCNARMAPLRDRTTSGRPFSGHFGWWA